MLHTERTSRFPLTVGTLAKVAGVLFIAVVLFLSIRNYNGVSSIQEEVSSLGIVYDKVKSSEESMDSRLNVVESSCAKDKKAYEELIAKVNALEGRIASINIADLNTRVDQKIVELNAQVKGFTESLEQLQTLDSAIVIMQTTVDDIKERLKTQEEKSLSLETDFHAVDKSSQQHEQQIHLLQELQDQQKMQLDELEEKLQKQPTQPSSAKPDSLQKPDEHGQDHKLSGKPTEVTGKSESISGKPETITDIFGKTIKPEPITGKPEPITGKPETATHYFGKSGKSSGKFDPISGKPETTTGKPDAITGNFGVTGKDTLTGNSADSDEGEDIYADLTNSRPINNPPVYSGSQISGSIVKNPIVGKFSHVPLSPTSVAGGITGSSSKTKVGTDTGGLTLEKPAVTASITGKISSSKFEVQPATQKEEADKFLGGDGGQSDNDNDNEGKDSAVKTNEELAGFADEDLVETVPTVPTVPTIPPKTDDHLHNFHDVHGDLHGGDIHGDK